MFPKRTHLKTDNQTELNTKLDDTSVDKTIKKVIERFSIECRKTKTKVITTAN